MKESTRDSVGCSELVDQVVYVRSSAGILKLLVSIMPHELSTH